MQRKLAACIARIHLQRPIDLQAVPVSQPLRTINTPAPDAKLGKSKIKVRKLFGDAGCLKRICNRCAVAKT